MQINLKIIMAFIALLVLSCENQTTWDFEQAESYLVADCIITNELKHQVVTLTRSDGIINHSPEGVSGAVINMTDGIHSVSFTEDPVEKGKYLSAVPFRAVVGRKYRITINIDNIFDTAYSEPVGISPLKPLEIVEKDGFYRYVYMESNKPSMTEIFYDWSDDENYCIQYGACQASEVFYTLDNMDISDIFSPDKQIIKFPRKTMIIRKMYSLNNEHQELLRSMLIETEWRGGIFDVEQGNVPTNFSNGLRGWFAACMVLSDTTYFE